jgi:hypothetical protein
MKELDKQNSHISSKRHMLQSIVYEAANYAVF